MRRLLILLLFAIFLSGCAVNTAAQRNAWRFQEKQFTASDGLTLTSWLASPGAKQKAPLVVLLHMLSKTHESYTPFIEALRQHVQADSTHKNMTLPYILNFDLRGHGKSTRVGDHELHYGSMGEANFKKIPNDVREMVLHILADSTYTIDSSNIMVVGASIGANSAVMVTELLPGVSKVVMLSPGENYRGLEPAQAVKDCKAKMLIFATSLDTYAVASSRKLAELNPKSTTLRVFKGKGHGTNIINSYPEAMHQLLVWLFPK